jgi:hypothetical protein
MPVVFNPFDPFSYVRAFSRPIYPAQPRPPAATPIEIDARASDPGMRITAARDQVTLRGVAAGPEQVRDRFGLFAYEASRSVSMTLDIDRAPTVDVFGQTNYRAKNNRFFSLQTRKGLTAADAARALADKVNAVGDFRATVKQNDDGSATIQLARR